MFITCTSEKRSKQVHLYMDKTKDQSYESPFIKLSLSIYSEKGLSIRHQEKHVGVKWSYSTGLIMSSPWKRSSQKNSRRRQSVEERIFEYREKMAGEISAGRRLWTRYFRFKNVESSLTSSSARPRSGTTWWSQGVSAILIELRRRRLILVLSNPESGLARYTRAPERG